MGILSRNQGGKSILFFYYGNRNIPAMLKLTVIFIKSPSRGKSCLTRNMMTKLTWKVKFGSWVLPQYNWNILFKNFALSLPHLLHYYSTTATEVFYLNQRNINTKTIGYSLTYIHTSSWNANLSDHYIQTLGKLLFSQKKLNIGMECVIKAQCQLYLQPPSIHFMQSKFPEM